MGSTSDKSHLPTPPAEPHNYPKSNITLEDRFIDEPRALRVAVIGGGLAGILAGILFPAKVPRIELVIYDKNSDLFATGSEIREYRQGLAGEYKVYDRCKLSTKVEELAWDEKESTWTLLIRDLKTNETTMEKADFVLPAIGRFNAWKLPDIPGISEYKGHLRHASNWDPSLDVSGKSVAVIGNGASGIQLVSNIQRLVGRLDHYARHKTWIAASWAGDERTFESQPISDEQKRSFDDPQTYLDFRKKLEDKYWRRFGGLWRGSTANIEAQKNFTENMKKCLSKKPELLDKMIPDFSANCRRPTPGPGYLEAISEDNLHYIQTPIKRITETGIETTDGTTRDVDAILCATGANIDMAPPFPIRANGVDLAAAWKSDGEYTFPYTYFGLATPGFPNLLFVHGAHGTGASGTIPQAVEVQLTYYAKVLRKVAREGIRTITPSKKAADEFVDYSDAFFAKTVLSDNCSSWYNSGRPGSRIHGLWPGSGMHITAVRREPRWEDWEYEYLSESGNRFEWYLGNGWTRKETDPTSDATSYLKLPSKIDLRDLHESWWDLP